MFLGVFGCFLADFSQNREKVAVFSKIGIWAGQKMTENAPFLIFSIHRPPKNQLSSLKKILGILARAVAAILLISGAL